MQGKGVNDLASLSFEAGKTYKIRVINMSALASTCIPSGSLEDSDGLVFFIHLDQHDTYIIEADGVEMEPFLIDTLTISIGQRYSLLVQAKSDPTANYALSIGQSEDM